MDIAVETYLDRVMGYANRRGAEAVAIRDELRDHLLEKIEHIRKRGLPIEDAVFTAIEENGQPRVVGYSLRPLFPLIDIRIRGTARGVIAIGPRAVGVFAFGGVAVGGVAVGALSCGVVSLGGMVAALLFGWAGIAFVPLGLAMAGLAIGMIAVGVLAAGAIASGWGALGAWAAGVQAASFYSYNTVPSFLRWVGPYIPTVEQQVSISVLMLALFLPAMLIAHIAMTREQRRLQQIDPDLKG